MTPDLWPWPTSPAHRLGRRLVRHLGVRRDRLYAWLESGAPALRLPDTGPTFSLSGYQASFAELEAILEHPAVLAAIERSPAAPLAEAPLPSPRLPRTAMPLGPRRQKPVRIVDLVPFGLELDVLELRFAQLYDVVDAFVVVESTRGYGGVAKPLFLQRNRARFARFAPKMHALVIDGAAPQGPRPARRVGTDWRGEMSLRAAMWRAARDLVRDDPHTLLISADCDELPPRHLLHWLREHDVPLPLRVRIPTLRYHLGWRDPRVFAEIVVLGASQFAAVDADPDRLRTWPGPTLAVRGGVHLTSFADPLALVAKFAMTTDWEANVVPVLRNAQGEAASMMARGRWFGRPLRRYDPVADPRGLVPEAMRLHRERFAHYWP